MTRVVSDYELFQKSSDRNRRLLRQEELILDVTERLSEALSCEGITKAELAKRLGKTKGFVSQILSGGRNLTLRTIADVADSLGCEIRIQLGKENRLDETGTQVSRGQNGRKIIPVTYSHAPEYKIARPAQVQYAKGAIGHSQVAA
ncbi:MAG: helix-turn-helix transcriptional regulator [candidate division NC10 bacterium]|nr:helix-turn-helix transcriptional regulator [candidate division NC10 bacterium]